MNNKKSQAAMEFLMTYGWAILIVLIVLAALFAFGIFTPRSPNTCSADAPFNCVDVRLQTGALNDQMIMNAGPVTGIPTFGTYSGTCTVAAWSGTFRPNSRNIITLTCPDTTPTGASFSGTFLITYTSASSGLSHTTTATYSGVSE
ncbi:MAG: hypothetical protein AABX61_03080 [Nanoarchaeota archaeon]